MAIGKIETQTLEVNSSGGVDVDSGAGSLNLGGVNATAVTITPATTFTGGFANQSIGGTLTWTGAQTFSSTAALSGGGSLAGTFSGNPTFSGASTFSNTINLPGGGSFTASTATLNVPTTVDTTGNALTVGPADASSDDAFVRLLAGSAGGGEAYYYFGHGSTNYGYVGSSAGTSKTSLRDLTNTGVDLLVGSTTALHLTSSTATFNVPTTIAPASTVAASFTASDYGKLQLTNVSSGTTRPCIVGANNTTGSTGAGLVLFGSTNDANTAGDIVFIASENNGTAFATTSRKAFSWNHSTTEIGNTTRAGAWTLGPSSGLSTAHLIQGNQTGSGGYVCQVQNNVSGSAAGGLYVAAGRSTSNADQCLRVDAQGATANFLVYGNGSLFVRTANWGTGGTAVGVSSNLLTTSPSSRRYKENETACGVDSSKIYDIEVKEFDYIQEKGGAHDFGPIAEDVELLIPEIVWKEEGNPESIRESKMVWLLLEEMKKLKARIEALENGGS